MTNESTTPDAGEVEIQLIEDELEEIAAGTGQQNNPSSGNPPISTPSTN
ncbi:hypothetical protein [Streptomyces sp. NPDC095817]